MYQELFTQLGLSPNESVVYLYLLKHGPTPAAEIIKETPLKKGLVYKILDDLVKKGLVSERRGKVAIFSPGHPDKLRELAQKRRQEARQALTGLENALPQMISDFNLVSNKPGVTYYEGLDGIKAVNEDSLTAKGMIRTYADVEAIMKNIPEINRAYVKKREKLGIKKRVISLDSPFARRYLSDYHRQVTDTRFIDHNKFPFKSVMQIYDGKIAISSIAAKHKMAMIIDNPEIYEMHKSIFDFTWQNAWTADQLKDRSKTQ